MEKEKELTPTPTLDRVELFIRQFDKANGIFSEAIVTKAVEERRRKELLEEALIAYADTIALLPANAKRLKRVVLDKIHAVEAMIEQEIEKSVSSSSNSIEVGEEALAGEARVRLLTID